MAIRDGLFLLVSLLLGFTLALASPRYAAAVSQTDRTPVTALYIDSLNETIDLQEKRIAALENRVPQSVWLLVISVSVIPVFARGLTPTSRFWVTLVLIPFTIAIVVAPRRRSGHAQ